MAAANAATTPSSGTSCGLGKMVPSRSRRRPIRAGHRRRTCCGVSAFWRHTTHQSSVNAVSDHWRHFSVFFFRSGKGIVGTQTSARRAAGGRLPPMSGRQRPQAGASRSPSATGTSLRASWRWRAGGPLWRPRGERPGRPPGLASVG